MDTRRRKRVVHRFLEDEYVDYKDVALLRKFMSDRGKIRSRRVTGLTAKRQREIATAIKNAREMGLLPYIQVRS
jgi:small subunit ribosomal protein S18